MVDASCFMVEKTVLLDALYLFTFTLVFTCHTLNICIITCLCPHRHPVFTAFFALGDFIQSDTSYRVLGYEQNYIRTLL